eukprot:Skav213930  [mRNA]  locus=scaffold2679:8517:12974:- [translate_table: standard]
MQWGNGIMKRERNVESYGKGSGARIKIGSVVEEWNQFSGSTVAVEAMLTGSGLWCEGALKQVEACNPKPGELPSEACEGGDPVDCAQSDWTPWSMCSVTCGGSVPPAEGGQGGQGGAVATRGGSKTPAVQAGRTRKILRHPKYGGKSCDGALAELKECARHACGGPAPIDCKYSSWNQWGDCDKCNGVLAIQIRCRGRCRKSSPVDNVETVILFELERLRKDWVIAMVKRTKV